MTEPSYDEDLGAFVIEGRTAGPAGALVVEFPDGSVLSLDRLDPTCPLDALLCGEPNRLGPDATALVEHLFEGQRPVHAHLPVLPVWSGETLVRARALGRVGLAIARGAGRESLWWAEAVQALGSWGLDLGWSPSAGLVQTWCGRAVGPLETLVEALPEAQLASGAGLGPLLALIDAVCDPLGSLAPPTLLDVRRRHGGETPDEADLGALMAELESASRPVGGLVFRGATGSVQGLDDSLRFRGGAPGDTIPPLLMGGRESVSASVELDVPDGLITGTSVERLDGERLLVTVDLAAETRNVQLHVAVVDERGARLDQVPAFVTGRVARAVLLVTAGATSRIRWSLSSSAPIGPSGDLERRSLLRAAARLADRTRVLWATEGSAQSLEPDWDEVARRWAVCGASDLSTQASEVRESLARVDRGRAARAFPTFVEAAAPTVVAGLDSVDPAAVAEPGQLVQLAYDAGAGRLAASLAEEGAEELRRRGRPSDAAAALRTGIAACSDMDDPPTRDRARLYEALGELGG